MMRTILTNMIMMTIQLPTLELQPTCLRKGPFHFVHNCIHTSFLSILRQEMDSVVFSSNRRLALPTNRI